MTTRGEIVQEARSWVGTRWCHQHSLKGVACDCIGLVRGVARHVGFNDPFATGEAQQFAGYARTPNPKELLKACAMFLVAIPHQQATLADILLFKYHEEPMHFAIISGINPAMMIHGHARARKVAENGIDAVWLSRVCGAYRFKELA